MYFTQASNFTDGNGNVNIAIAGAVTVYTKAMEIGMASAFSLSEILSGANPTVMVEMQLSDTAPAALEAVADSSGTDWCTQDGGAPIWTALADGVYHKITVNPAVSKFMRLKLTGNGGNGALVTGVFKLTKQEQLGR